MTKQEIEAKRAELMATRAAKMAELSGVKDEAKFNELRTSITALDFQLDELEKDENRAAAEAIAAEQRGARPPQAQPVQKPGANPLAAEFKGATQTADAPELSTPEVLRYSKSAFGKEMRAMLKKLGTVEYSDNEKRALGVSIITSEKAFTAATEAADGVSNGGIFIHDNVMYDLLEIDRLDSPFLRDCMPSNIRGAVIFPYVEERTVPAADKRGKAEKEASTDVAVKWGKMTLPQGNYPLTIEITMEVLALNDEAFAQYVLDELRNEIDLLLGDEVFYGSGTDNRIEGVTVGAIKADYENIGDGIKAAFARLSRRARKDAKLYLSRSVSLDMAFEKDADGRYQFPIYNTNGIESIVRVPVEVDEGLADGSFLYGNAKNYKLNFVKQTEVYGEIDGKHRIISYTAHLMPAAKAAPNKFYYGTKKAVSPAKTSAKTQEQTPEQSEA